MTFADTGIAHLEHVNIFTGVESGEMSAQTMLLFYGISLAMRSASCTESDQVEQYSRTEIRTVRATESKSAPMMTRSSANQFRTMPKRETHRRVTKQAARTTNAIEVLTAACPRKFGPCPVAIDEQ